MRVFNELIQIDNKGDIVYNRWIEWDYFLIPNKPDWFRQFLRRFVALFGHCKTCTVLDGCYFVERIMPNLPLHINCDCKKLDKSFATVKSNAKAECDIRKFTDYVFKDNTSGKKQIFLNLGYNLNDAFFLQQEFCTQALKNYLLGNYKLKTLNSRGQRLAIPITLNSFSFYSGWMMYPEGLIKNTTPFGGWIK